MVTNVDLSMMSHPLNLNDKDKEVAAQIRRLKIPIAGALCNLPKQTGQPNNDDQYEDEDEEQS